MEWKPILTYKWNAWALGMIDDISRCIMRQDLTARAQGLLYGNAGTDVYLFHAADLKNDDKLFDWATDLLGLFFAVSVPALLRPLHQSVLACM